MKYRIELVRQVTETWEAEAGSPAEAMAAAARGLGEFVDAEAGGPLAGSRGFGGVLSCAESVPRRGKRDLSQGELAAASEAAGLYRGPGLAPGGGGGIDGHKIDR